MAAGLIPFSLWLDGSVAANRFYPYLAEQAPHQTQGFRVKDGRAYSAYPIALPLLLTPLYAPAALAARTGGWGTGRIVIVAAILEKWMASLVASLSVAAFLLLARRLAGPGSALAATLIYAFATETWAISSQALWQHGGGELAVIAALYGLVRFQERPGEARWLLAAGAAAGGALAIRPTNALLLAAVGAWLMAARRPAKDWLAFWVAPLLLGALTAAYNLHVFGRLAGGNAPSFDSPLLAGLAGTLLSPGRGLLVYTPVAAFSVWGAWLWLRNRREFPGPVWPVSIGFTVLLVLVVSKWRVWWGGHCWGPRLLTDAAPCLAVLLLPALARTGKSAAVVVLFAVAAAGSAGAQALGAFCYPATRWDETPVTIGERPSRLWDWRDSPLVRSARAGPRIGPDPSALPAIRKAI